VSLENRLKTCPKMLEMSESARWMPCVSNRWVPSVFDAWSSGGGEHVDLV
jgi:hypothetical protein